jgi:hypothetical protein
VTAGLKRKTKKQERRMMTQEGAQGIPADAQGAAAANEDFIATANGADPVSPRLGWDPYEVWRTRVKLSAAVQELERKPPG